MPGTSPEPRSRMRTITLIDRTWLRARAWIIHRADQLEERALRRFWYR